MIVADHLIVDMFVNEQAVQIELSPQAQPMLTGEEIETSNYGRWTVQEIVRPQRGRQGLIVKAVLSGAFAE